MSALLFHQHSSCLINPLLLPQEKDLCFYKQVAAHLQIILSTQKRNKNNINHFFKIYLATHT